MFVSPHHLIHCVLPSLPPKHFMNPSLLSNPIAQTIILSCLDFKRLLPLSPIFSYLQSCPLQSSLHSTARRNILQHKSDPTTALLKVVQSFPLYLNKRPNSFLWLKEALQNLTVLCTTHSLPPSLTLQAYLSEVRTCPVCCLWLLGFCASWSLCIKYFLHFSHLYIFQFFFLQKNLPNSHLS